MTFIVSMIKSLKTILKRLANKLKKEVKSYISNWNSLYPIDFWWRKKYDIPFGSEQHLQATFIQMFFDYEEEKLMNSILAKKSEDTDEEGFNFEKAQEKSGVGKNMSQEQIDDDFDNLDVSSYNKVEKDETKDETKDE
mgnify:CR=1 FL=1